MKKKVLNSESCEREGGIGGQMEDRGGSPWLRWMKRAGIVLWLGVLLTGLVVVLRYPEALKPESLVQWFREVEGYVFWVFVGTSLVRGLALLPSTPFVVAGTLLFPDAFLTVFLISMVGILASASLIYGLSEVLGFDVYFQKKFPQKIDWVKERLNSPWGFGFVVGWAFFPLVPTDLVCYVAGTTRMKFHKFLGAITLGEIPLVLLYMLGTGTLGRFV